MIIQYNQWTVQYNPKPIPNRKHDWDFWHEDHDGADGGNGLAGTGESSSDCFDQIQEIELELDQGDRL